MLWDTLMKFFLLYSTFNKIHIYFYFLLFFIGRKGTYFEVNCFWLGGFSSELMASLLEVGWGPTNSVIIFNPLESSIETTRGGGDSPPSVEEECTLFRIFLETTVRLLADKMDNEAGGHILISVISRTIAILLYYG